MRVRLGYVAIALNLPNVTSSSTLTFTRYEKLMEQEKINKLKQVTNSNLEDLKKILQYNGKNGIEFYRMTSKLVPLATHPEVKDWHYLRYFEPDFRLIGDIIREYKMRVDTHPDQFDVINSHREDVFQNTVRDLMYHEGIFKAMHIESPKVVLHVGGSQGGKEAGIKRFIENFKRLPESIQKMVILENDDKIYTVKDVLYICQNLKIPMVLDVHHHWCNGSDQINIEKCLLEILQTWKDEILPPKIHLSSPREHDMDKKHADYIRIEDFFKTMELFLPYNKDFDIMLEAKKKDQALLQLIKEIKKTKPNWHWENPSTLII